MGTVVQISRSKVIEALKKEPVETLQGGTWVRTWGFDSLKTKVSNKDCPGALLELCCVTQY